MGGASSFQLAYTTSWDGGASSTPTIVTVPANYAAGNGITLDSGITWSWAPAPWRPARR